MREPNEKSKTNAQVKENSNNVYTIRLFEEFQILNSFWISGKNLRLFFESKLHFKSKCCKIVYVFVISQIFSRKLHWPLISSDFREFIEIFKQNPSTQWPHLGFLSTSDHILIPLDQSTRSPVNKWFGLFEKALTPSIFPIYQSPSLLIIPPSANPSLIHHFPSR